MEWQIWKPVKSDFTREWRKKAEDRIVFFFFFTLENLVGCLYVYEDKPTEIEKKYDDVEEKNEEFQK